MARIGKQLFPKSGWRPCPCGQVSEFGANAVVCRCGRATGPQATAPHRRASYSPDGERLATRQPIIEAAERIVHAEHERIRDLRTLYDHDRPHVAFGVLPAGSI